MNDREIAHELVRIAKGLTADGKIDMLKGLIPSYRSMANAVSNRVDRIKYVDGKTRDKEVIRRDRYIRMMNWTAYSRSDFEYDIYLYLEQRGLDSWVMVHLTGPYGTSKPIDGKGYKGLIPVDEIIKAIEGALQ